MPKTEAIFDPVSAHPDMLFGNAGRGGPHGTHLRGESSRHTKADLTKPVFIIRSPLAGIIPRHQSTLTSGSSLPALTLPTSTLPEMLATTERASLISVTAEAIAILGTVP